MIATLLEQLAASAARAAVDRVSELVHRATGARTHGRTDEHPRGLSYRDVAHQQAQIRSATAQRSEKGTPTPKPKPDTLP